MQKDIAIIGIAGKFPGAEDVSDFWNNIRNSIESISKFPENRKKDAINILSAVNHEDFKQNYIFRNGGYIREVDKFDYSFFNISPKEAMLINPQQRLFLETVWNAIEDSGYCPIDLKKSKTGVYVGVRETGGISYADVISKIDPQLMPIAIPGNSLAFVPSRVSYILDLKGPAISIDTACSSSFVALHLACKGITNGDCDTAIVGGIRINLFPLEDYAKIGIESSDEHTRVFDNKANGTSESEAVVAIYIKPLNKALDDRDNIYAVIKGSAINQDGRSIGITAPDSKAQEDVIINAWKDANIENPECISYIEAHGTGTKLGDPTEILAIRKAFKRFTDKKQFCAIGSVKSNIGHTESAAGLVGLVKCIMAIKYRILPPTINFKIPNQKISFHKSPVYINDRVTEWETSALPRKCGVSSFGLSGTNCHVILEEPPYNKNNSVKEITMNILTISGKRSETIDILILKYLKFIDDNEDIDIGDFCYTANTGRGHYNFRLAVIVNDKEDLRQKLILLAENGVRNLLQEEIHYGEINSRDDRKKLTYKSKYKIKELLDEQCTDIGLLDEICALYVKGANVMWKELYSEGDYFRLSIPTYPFDNVRCWIDIKNAITNNNEQKPVCHTVYWKRKELLRENSSGDAERIVLFTTNRHKKNVVAQKLRKKDFDVIEVISGEKFKTINDNTYIIGRKKEEYVRLFNLINNDNIIRIIHMCSVKDRSEITTLNKLDKVLGENLYSLFNLVNSIAEVKIKQVDLIIISQNAGRVVPDDITIPENAAVFGLGKVVNWESNKVRCRCLDIDYMDNSNYIIEEICSSADEYMIAYRNGVRYAETIKELDIHEKVEMLHIKNKGAYIITGGMGDVGLEICKCLASSGNANMVLVNRSAIPPREEWNNIIESNRDTGIVSKLKNIMQIENTGSKLEFYSTDISIEEQLEKVLDEVRMRHGRINGIVHLAGVENLCQLQSQSLYNFKMGLRAKIYGTWLLDKLTMQDDMDFFVLFSSVMTLIGGVGFSTYTSSNYYLDSYSCCYSPSKRKIITLNWPTWLNTGLAISKSIDMDKLMFEPLDTQDAVNIFKTAVNSSYSRLVIGKINYKSRIFDMKKYLPFRIYSENSEYIEPPAEDLSIGNQEINVVLDGRKNDNYTELELLIARVWNKVLGHKKINICDSFSDLGGDSIIAVNLETEMENNNLNLKASDIEIYPTIEKMAEYLKNSFTKEQKEIIRVQQDIEPFNEFFYKSCFFDSLFPVVKFYDRSILAFLVNDIVRYTYNEDTCAIKAEYKEVEEFDKILSRIDLQTKSKNRSEDIINDLIKSLSYNKFVILWIDCFFEPIRRDTYMKMHWPHTVLFYGFDSSKKVFNIIEHSHLNSLSYKKQIINFEDVIKCYNGFFDFFTGDISEPTYYEMFMDGAHEIKENYSSHREYRMLFGKNVQSNRSEIEIGIENLKKFSDYLSCYIKNRIFDKEESERILENLNTICNAKKVEFYRTKGLFEDHNDIIFLIKTIEETWNYIRRHIAKHIYSSKNFSDDIEVIIKKIEYTSTLELIYNKLLFSII